MLYAIVALLVIIFDQWTKFWVAGNIALNTGSRPLIPGIVQLVNIHNDGAALGFLSGKNAGMFFIILCAVFTIFVIVALATRLVKSPVGRWSLLFIMAGGLSNCIDRVLSGYVQDMFMPLFMDNLPIFNVADIFITVFCLVFILYVLFGGRGDDDYEDEEDEEEYVDVDEESDDLEDEDERAERQEKRAKGLGFLFGRRGEDDEDEDEDEEEDDEEEEEEDEEDEEEDDLPPARRPSKYDRAARNGKRPEKGGLGRLFSRSDEEDEDDEEEDEEEEAPVRRRQSKPAKAEKKAVSRRDRQAELDEKYARFKAERAAREQQWSAPVPEEKPPVVDPADPFAEWDAANAAQKQTPPQRPAAPVAEPAPAAPVAEPAPAPAPAAPKPAPQADESMEFSLEDILAEFK